jgi:SIR2-like domain
MPSPDGRISAITVERGKDAAHADGRSAAAHASPTKPVISDRRTRTKQRATSAPSEPCDGNYRTNSCGSSTDTGLLWPQARLRETARNHLCRGKAVVVGLSAVQQAVLRRYTRAIVHMRRQFAEHRFGLIFGAGIGADLKLPSWSELIDRIADHPKVKGRGAIQDVSGFDQSLTIQIQKLYEFFRLKMLPNIDPQSETFRHREKQLVADWRAIITECLYRDVEDYTPEGITRRHPYLGAYADLIALCDVTINYNFDETLQVLLSGRHRPDTRIRSFKTISKGIVRPRSIYNVLYHPNGFLPRNLIESTDPIVFTEESFADQLLQMNQNMDSLLLNHLGTKTCLLVGLSLNDPNLKHLLRRGATASPGQCHYYVCFYDKEEIRDDAKISITNANFNVYNLVTLFLNRDELAALGHLLSMEEAELRQGAEQIGVQLKYVYYVTGPMGVGKSTCLANLYSLTTYDEWSEERLPALAKDRHRLRADEDAEVRAWLGEQFYRKNWSLSDTRIGIHLVDRPPLDPLAFTNRTEWARRATEQLAAIVRGPQGHPIQSGHVILLTGEPGELQGRIIAQNKLSTVRTLEENQRFLAIIYDCSPGMTRIDTRTLSVSEVVHQIARIIHLDPYHPADLQTRLMEFANPAQAEFRFES